MENRTLRFIVAVQSQLDRIERELSGVRRAAEVADGASVDIPVSVTRAAQARAELQGVKDSADEVGRASPIVNVSERGSAATLVALGNVERVAERVGRASPTVTVDSRGVGTTLAELQALERQMDRLDGRTVNVRVRQTGAGPAAAGFGLLGGRMGRIIALIPILVGLLAPLIPIINALGGGAFSLAGALGQALLGAFSSVGAAAALAAGGLTLFGLGIAAAVKDYPPAGDALKRLRGQYKGLASDLSAIVGPALANFLNTAADNFGIFADAAKLAGQTGSAALDVFTAKLEAPPQLGVLDSLLTAMGRNAGVAFAVASDGVLILLNTINAAVPAGERFLGFLSRAFERAQAFTSSAEGQSRMTGFFDRAADAAARLWEGTVDVATGLYNVGSALSESGLTGKLTQGLLDLTQRFVDVTAEGSRGREMIVDFGRKVGPVLSAVGGVLGTLVTEWFRVGDAIMTARDEMGRLILPQVLKDLEILIPKIGDFIETTFVELAPHIWPLIDNLVELATVVAESGVYQTLLGILVKLLDVFLGLPGPVQDVVIWVAALAGPALAAVNAFRILSFLLGPVIGLLGAVSAPVWLIVGAVAALVAGGVALWAYWDEFHAWLDKLPPGVKQAVDALTLNFRLATSVIGGLLTGDWSKFKDLMKRPIEQGAKIWDSLPPRAQQAFGLVYLGARTAGNVLRGIFTGNWKPAIESASKLWDLLPNRTKAALRPLGPAVRLGGNIIRGAVTGNWRPAVNQARNIWNGLPAQTRAKLRPLGPAVRLGGNLIRGAITGNWRPAVNSAKQLWNSLPSSVRQKLRPVGQAVRFGGTLIRGAFTGNWKPAIESGKRLWDSLPPGVRQRASRVGSVLRQGAQQFVRAPFSSTWRGAVSFGQNLFNALPPGVRQRASRVEPVMRDVGGLVRSVFTQDWGGAVRHGTSLFDRLPPGVRERLSKAGPIARDVGGIVRGIFTNDWGSAVRHAVSLFDQLAPGARRRLTDMADAIGSFVSRLRQLGIDLIQGLIDGINSMASALTGAIGNLLNQAYEAGKAAIGAGSPSRLWRGTIGNWTGQGAVLGIRDQIPAAARAARDLMLAATPGRLGALPATPALAGAPMPGLGRRPHRSPVTFRSAATQRVVHTVRFEGPGAENLDEETVADMLADRMETARRRGE